MSYQSAQALLNRGVSRPTLYSVQLPQSFISRQTNDYVNFFCVQTAIPEVMVNTAFIPGQENMGIVREQPTGIQFSKPFTMSIIENSDFTVYKELRSWFDRTAQNANQFVNNRNVRMQYYDTYTSDMEIIKLEQTANQTGILGEVFDNSNYKQTLRVKFINAYPINIGSVELASTDTDNFTVFDASFTYESYTIAGPGVTENIGQLATLASSILNLF